MTCIGQNGEPDLTLSIIQKVAESKEVSPVDLDPLYQTINPEALDDLFQAGDNAGQVEFVYEGYTVVVHSDETVDLIDG